MYSWRRTVVIETRRRQGTEMAKEVANRSMDSSSMKPLMAYDDLSLADLAMIGTRLNEETVSRSYLRDLFGERRISETYQ